MPSRCAALHLVCIGISTSQDWTSKEPSFGAGQPCKGKRAKGCTLECCHRLTFECRAKDHVNVLAREYARASGEEEMMDALIRVSAPICMSVENQRAASPKRRFPVNNTH